MKVHPGMLMKTNESRCQVSGVSYQTWGRRLRHHLASDSVANAEKLQK